MLNSNTLNWNQVKADFGDTNTAMRTALGGFSQAGDVFTKMRDRLAAEEQQDIENEQWEKEHQLNLDRFGFDKDKEAQRVIEEARRQDEIERAALVAEDINRYTAKSGRIQANAQAAHLANTDKIALEKHQDEMTDNRALSDATDFLASWESNPSGGISKLSQQLIYDKAELDSIKGMTQDEWKASNSNYKSQQDEITAREHLIDQRRKLTSILQMAPQANLTATGRAGLYALTANAFGYTGQLGKEEYRLTDQKGIDAEYENYNLDQDQKKAIQKANTEYEPGMFNDIRTTYHLDNEATGTFKKMAKTIANSTGRSYKDTVKLLGAYVTFEKDGNNKIGSFNLSNEDYIKLLEGDMSNTIEDKGPGNDTGPNTPFSNPQEEITNIAARLTAQHEKATGAIPSERTQAQLYQQAVNEYNTSPSEITYSMLKDSLHTLNIPLTPEATGLPTEVLNMLPNALRYGEVGGSFVPNQVINLALEKNPELQQILSKVIMLRNYNSSVSASMIR